MRWTCPIRYKVVVPSEQGSQAGEGGERFAEKESVGEIGP